MVKIKVSEASGLALDWIVGLAEGYELNVYGVKSIRARIPGLGVIAPWRPTYYWNQGGPIIERELLEVTPHFRSANYERPNGQWEWKAYVLGPTNLDDDFEQDGPTPLIAAMRCYVVSKLGEEVEVSDELLEK